MRLLLLSILEQVYQDGCVLSSFSWYTAGQSHLNFKGVIEYELKPGEAGRERGELRALESIFAQLKDRPMERTKRHRLRHIIIIAICVVICGVDGWAGIDTCGR